MKLERELCLGSLTLDSINGGVIKVELRGKSKVVWRTSAERLKLHGLEINQELLSTPPEELTNREFTLVLETNPTPLIKWSGHDTIDNEKSTEDLKVKELARKETIAFFSGCLPPQSFFKKKFALKLVLDLHPVYANDQEFEIELTEAEYNELLPLIKNGSGIVLSFNFELKPQNHSK